MRLWPEDPGNLPKKKEAILESSLQHDGMDTLTHRLCSGVADCLGQLTEKQDEREMCVLPTQKTRLYASKD